MLRVKQYLAHLVIDFVAFPWQAMQELPVWVRTTLLAQLLSYLVTLEVFESLRLFSLLAHRNPLLLLQVSDESEKMKLESIDTHQVSVTTTSAPLTASYGLSVQKMFFSQPNSLTRSQTGFGHWYAYGGCFIWLALCVI
jgi:hypothetical protein